MEKPDRGGNINLALSGWSGSGTTATTMILALLVEGRYFPVTQIFRTVGKEIGMMTSNGDDAGMAEAEAVLQPQIGRLVDTYVDHKLLHDQGIVLESDLSGFRIGKDPRVFSIFLKTDFDTRVKRYIKDNRGTGAEVLRARDEALKKEYMQLWEIDLFDQALIAEKFHLVLDTSELSLKQVVMVIAEELQRIQGFEQLQDTASVNEMIHELCDEIDRSGKEGLKALLDEQGLVVSVDMMMQEIAELFPEESAEFPDQIKQLFEKD